MATVDEILTRQAYAAGDETWTKDNNYPSYTMYAEPEYVPVTNKRIADFNDQVSVRGEQNAQFVGFQLPRYDDAMDLTKQNLYIHYQTVYGGSDGVPCNVSRSANYVRMCWMIPGQATQEPGSIQMMIYATGTDSVGDRTVWKTLPATYTIHDGLDIGGGIPEPDPSWYEQFVAQMESKVSTAQGYANDAQASKVAAAGSATAAAQSADASAQALAENKDYVESQKETFVGYNKRESDLQYANALIGSASGTGRVTVGDAWGTPIPDLGVAGKSDQFTTTGAQLFDASLIPALTAGGVTVEGTADGGYHISGSGDSGTFYKTVKITDLTMLKAGNIMLKSESSVPKFSVRLMDSSSTILFELTADQTRTITEEMLSTEGVYLQYMFYGAVSNVTPGTYYPMLYQDGDGTWEPYTGGQPSPSPEYPQPIISTGTVTTGAQMLDFRNGKSGTVGGITYTNVGDGTYKRTGTVTSSSGAVWFLGGYNITPNADDSNVIVTLKKGVEYIAKDCWLFWFLDNAAFSCEEGKPFTPESDIKITGVRNPWQVEGSTYNDVIRPTLVEGNTVIWEPYTGGKPSPSEEYPQPLGVTVTGANLFDANAIKTTSSNGISFVNNNDGSITVKGTSLDSADTYGVKVDLQPGIYHTSGGQGNVKIMVRVKDNGETKYYSNHDFVVSTDSYVDIYMHVDSGKTVDATIWPMLNAGSTALPWQPYQSKTATITLTEPLCGIGDVRDRILCRDGEWGIERYCPVSVFDGSTDEKWNEASTNDAAKKRYNCKVGGRVADLIRQTALCSHFPLIRAGGTLGNIRGFTIANDYIQLYLDGRPLEEFKTWLQEHPITLVYQMDTPTWEPLPAATQSALNALTTFTGTTHINITAGGPEPDVMVEYVQDTRAVIADIMAQINEIRGGIV
ncbi:hypothetical protein [Enterocloster citroniae]|uniref:hypothetical protein n=1 Tax=Enterocloster citroniae TaxID=358743 RepID=UPI0034A5BFC7